jgi:hypothetical protein
VNRHSFFKRIAASALAAASVFAVQSQAQNIPGASAREYRVAEGNNLYCAGYVSTAPVSADQRIVGGYNEQDGWLYSQRNIVYLNMGSDSGVKPGDMFSVVRPRGQVKTRWTKKGDLGMYVQEIGSVEVVRVNADHSVAKVKVSCDNFLLGDLVRPMETRVAPVYTQRAALDVFAAPSGKPVGRVFMARDNLEVLGRDHIVYVDLGTDESVSVGDRLTVFRPLGKGNPLEGEISEAVFSKESGYQSDQYKGSYFSNQAGRKSGENASGSIVTTAKAKEGRPFIRKVVGEMVVLNVKEKTATAVIVRNAQEIHTGDYVEVQ